MAKIKVRKGMPSVQLDRREFKKRFQARFYDPVFEPLQPEIDKIADAAWIAYADYHKTPRACSSSTAHRAASTPARAKCRRPTGSSASPERRSSIGYYEPYATSHDALDRDEGVQADVRNAARALVQAVKDRRSGKLQPPDRGLHEAKPK